MKFYNDPIVLIALYAWLLTCRILMTLVQSVVRARVKTFVDKDIAVKKYSLSYGIGIKYQIPIIIVCIGLTILLRWYFVILAPLLIMEIIIILRYDDRIITLINKKMNTEKFEASLRRIQLGEVGLFTVLAIYLVYGK